VTTSGRRIEIGRVKTPNLYVYAHCLRNHPGGVALLVINADAQQVNEVTLVPEAERYTLTAKQLQDRAVQLNRKTLELNSDSDVPEFDGQRTRTGRISFAPASITFLAIPNASNSSCR
jgi:heparanase